MEIQRGSAPALVQQVHGEQRVRGAKKQKQKKAGEATKAVLAVLGRIVDASWVNMGSRRQIQGLLQSQSGSSADARAEDADELRLTGSPKAAAFESATGGVLKTLEDMKEKAEEALSSARNEEMKKQHSFDMMAQSLTDGIEVGKEKIAKSKENMNAAIED